MNNDLFSYVDPSPPAGPDGPLAGVSAVIQPNMSVRGWPTEAGSRALARYVAIEDATVVERLRTAGATIVGGSRMAELGFGLAGDTTAQAMKDVGCRVALLNDTLGEARQAALSAGLVGFKPTFGLVSRFGLIGLVPSMECYGLLAAGPLDAAEVMAALVGEDERDVSMRSGTPVDFVSAGEAKTDGVVVGVISQCMEALEPAQREAFRTAVSKLEGAGARIEEIALPDFDLFRMVHHVVGSTEASSSAGKYDGVRYGHRAEGVENWNEMYLESRAEAFGPLVKAYLFQGAYFQFEDYPAFEAACRIRGRLLRQTESLFGRVDMLALPLRGPKPDATTAGTVDEVYDAFALTLLANVTGQPSLGLPGVPCGEVDLGLQLVGRALEDATLLSYGAGLWEGMSRERKGR